MNSKICQKLYSHESGSHLHHRDAVAESFFQLLKRERIRPRVYKNREEARNDIFDYIEMFYNPVRRYGHVGNVSPVEFERQYLRQLSSV